MKSAKTFFIIYLLACLLLSSCGATVGGPLTWIDRPQDGGTVPLAPVSILAHATDSDSVRSIEFYVNGQLMASVEPNFDVNERLGYAEWEFTPTSPGVYRIEVSAIDPGGAAGSPATATITVSGEVVASPPTDLPPTEPPATEAPTEEVPTEPPLTQPKPTEPPPSGGVTVSFYADPASVEAGGCSTLHWDVEGTEMVYWNGASVYYRGMEERCNLCEAETHKLQVVKPDNSTQDYWVTISVSGSCSAPPAETQPPSVDVLPPDPLDVEVPDTTPPNIWGTGTNKSSICPNETVTSNIIAFDEESGIKKVYANWVLRDASGKKIGANYVEYSPLPSQDYGYTAVFGSFDNSGTLTINGVVENNANLTTTFSHEIKINIC